MCVNLQFGEFLQLLKLNIFNQTKKWSRDYDTDSYSHISCDSFYYKKKKSCFLKGMGRPGGLSASVSDQLRKKLKSNCFKNELAKEINGGKMKVFPGGHFFLVLPCYVVPPVKSPRRKCVSIWHPIFTGRELKIWACHLLFHLFFHGILIL